MLSETSEEMYEKENEVFGKENEVFEIYTHNEHGEETEFEIRDMDGFLANSKDLDKLVKELKASSASLLVLGQRTIHSLLSDSIPLVLYAISTINILFPFTTQVPQMYICPKVYPSTFQSIYGRKKTSTPKKLTCAYRQNILLRLLFL